MVFEQLPVHSKVQEEPPSDNKTATPPAQEGGVGERDIEGDKDGRKRWGEGEGAPVVELLQHKQLQTATYAVDDGSTGMYTCMSQFWL